MKQDKVEQEKREKAEKAEKERLDKLAKIEREKQEREEKKAQLEQEKKEKQERLERERLEKIAEREAQKAAEKAEKELKAKLEAEQKAREEEERQRLKPSIEKFFNKQKETNPNPSSAVPTPQKSTAITEEQSLDLVQEANKKFADYSTKTEAMQKQKESIIKFRDVQKNRKSFHIDDQGPIE